MLTFNEKLQIIKLAISIAFNVKVYAVDGFTKSEAQKIAAQVAELSCLIAKAIES